MSRRRVCQLQSILHGGFDGGPPVVIIEVVLMSAMYPNKKWNTFMIIVSLVFFVLFWFGIRRQVAISDRQFLKSMIPHDAGAIVMCERAQMRDPEIKQLCEEIKSSQQREINQMKSKLQTMSAR
jgi:Domain of unknown function (DUF305)